MLQVYFSEPSTFASAFVKTTADKKAMVDKRDDPSATLGAGNTPVIARSHSCGVTTRQSWVSGLLDCIANIMDRTYYIYIMTNKGNRVLYTGVTGNLVKRVYQHRERQVQGFTSRYNVTKLVYFEIFNNLRFLIIKYQVETTRRIGLF